MIDVRELRSNALAGFDGNLEADWTMPQATTPSRKAQLVRLAELPVINVPTITLEGDANGAPHADPAIYVSKYSGK